MEQYNVTGMSCAACSARVEKAVSAVPGVDKCNVNLLTNSMSVEGTATPDDIIKAVENAGYGASPKNAETKSSENADPLPDKETPVLKKRLIFSLLFLIPLMYISMGHMMWGFPLPAFMEGNHVAMGIAQMLFAAVIMVINQKFFINGFKGIIHLSPNMDTLVAMGSGISFVWSVYVLFHMTGAVVSGNEEAVMNDMMNFYFESAGMILTLITVGKMLEAHSKGKTTDALKGLMKLTPQKATVLIDGKEKEINAKDVKKNDIFIVRPGDSIPVDGIVTEGESAVNESALTGESIPCDKTEGDKVFAATINQSGFLKCRASNVGDDTSIARIIKMVSDASSTKAPIAKVADKVSGVFVPAVVLISLITFIIWMICVKDVGYSLARAIAVLVISCPCALGLATPVAIMVGNGVAAKNGILFKTAEAIEITGKVNVAALDKTGTITMGEPGVTDIIPYEISENELLKIAFSLETKSEHPLAKAIIDYSNKHNITRHETDDFRAMPGNGLVAVYKGHEIYGGNRKFVESKTLIPDEHIKLSEKLSEEGKTPLFFAVGDKYAGIISVADMIKEDSFEGISELKNMGIHVVMLTGDNERTAKAIGNIVGVDEVIAGVLPDEKANVVNKLKSQGKVAMIGDGINDAPALTCADAGIAIGAGTDIAIDAADVVLTKNSIKDSAAAIRLSRGVLKNIYENLFWAFIYNIIGIPLAAGAFINVFGWELNPMFGAAAMSLSSFCVVTNALRLNFFNVYPKNKNVNKEEEINKMSDANKYSMKIEGMMCPHCEATVKKTIEGFEEVLSAYVSHEKGIAEITFKDSNFNVEQLEKAVEDKGYKVIK